MQTFLFWLEERSYEQLTLSYKLKSYNNYSSLNQYTHFIVYACKLKQASIPKLLTKENVHEYFEIKMIIYLSTGYDRGTKRLLLESAAHNNLYNKMVRNELETEPLHVPCTVFLPMDCKIYSSDNYDGYLVEVALDLDVENVNLIAQPKENEIL